MCIVYIVVYLTLFQIGKPHMISTIFYCMINATCHKAFLYYNTNCSDWKIMGRLLGVDRTNVVDVRYGTVFVHQL